MDGMAQLAGTRFPYSVLVVDQRPHVLARLVKPLREAGCDVFAVTTFEEAKRRLASFTPRLEFESLTYRALIQHGCEVFRIALVW